MFCGFCYRIGNWCQSLFWKKWNLCILKNWSHPSTYWWQIWNLYQCLKGQWIPNMGCRSWRGITTGMFCLYRYSPVFSRYAVCVSADLYWVIWQLANNVFCYAKHIIKMHVDIWSSSVHTFSSYFVEIVKQDMVKFIIVGVALSDVAVNCGNHIFRNCR